MTKTGYARVGGEEQNLDRQPRALEGASKIFSDELSGQSVEYPQLQAMPSYIRERNIVVVTELGRLGRNNKELTELANQVQIKRTTLEILDLSSVNGIEDESLRRLIDNLVTELYKYQVGSECKQVKERQTQGIGIIKKKGKFKRRRPKFRENNPRLQHAFGLFLNSRSDKGVEERTEINRRTFRRYRSRYDVTVDQRKKQ